MKRRIGFTPLEAGCVETTVLALLTRFRKSRPASVASSFVKRASSSLRGFTLLEMMIVVVVIGILASIALPRYTRIVEKGRSAEARHVLGLIRDAELAYYLDFDRYTNSLTALGVQVPGACNTSYYFSYAIAGAPASFTATATRCTGGTGKTPSGATTFVLNMTPAGSLGGSAGFV